MKIFKYPLAVTDNQTVDLPLGAVVLSVDNQAGQLCLWAAVNDWLPIHTVEVRVIGTGHEINDFSSLEFVGTVLIDPFVWHVFLKENNSVFVKS